MKIKNGNTYTIPKKIEKGEYNWDSLDEFPQYLREVRPEFFIGTDKPFYIKKQTAQESYNRKLLRLYRLMVNKKDNGQKLWDFIMQYPCEMLAKAKIELKEKLK